MQNFYMPTRMIYGKDAVKENSTLLKELGGSCLIVVGKNTAKSSGALDDALCALKKENISFSIVDTIGSNPLLGDCHSAGKAAREAGAEFILGIGGGSMLDAAKAVAIFAANEQFEPEDIYSRANCSAPLPVALIGTTAGTGSEVTGVSVLTNEKTGRKKSISGPDCYARVSLCDPKYTYSVPYGVTVSTALDAFAHAVEGFFTPKAQGIPELYAEKCIPAIFNALCWFYETKSLPDEKMRDSLYLASIYAGFVINTCGTGFPHPLGYVLTENYGVPHGAACAAFFPAFLDRAAKFAPEKTDRFLALCGEEADTIKEVVKTLSGVKINMTPEQAQAFSARWEDSVPKNFTASPGSLTKEEAQKILLTV